MASSQQHLSLEASRLPSSAGDGHGHGRHDSSWSAFTLLAFQSIGVVFGDVGTSPLYVFSSTFTPSFPPTHSHIQGALSLIFWTLLLLPLIKYTIVMRANDHGNGGTFALYSLICRHARVSQLPHHHADDDNHHHAHEDLSVYSTSRKSPPDRTSASRRSRRASTIKRFLERNSIAKHLLLVLTLLGTCSVIGDGTLTPAISVLSAVDGIQVLIPSLSTNAVAGISILILVFLFSLQRYGTAKVGGLFAPIVLLWFFSIFSVGVYNIVKNADSWWMLLLSVMDPRHIFWYFRDGGKAAWISLGGIVLCITGTEAMFADLGHFSAASIQAALRFVVAPSLLAAYIGQGAYLMKFPEDVSHAFYKSIPSGAFIFVFIVAVAAAVIASQAMISATFSIVQQSHALGCFPHVKVVHTSSHVSGQVYVPEVNWILMALCIAITGGFKTTTLIGNAYGIVVIAVMLISTLLLSLIMLLIWETPIYLVLPFALTFASLEGMYFSSNLYKFVEGGFIPVAFASFLLIIMLVWHCVSMKKYQYEAKHTLPAEEVLQSMRTTLDDYAVVPGVGLVYTHQIRGVPPIYHHFIDNVHAVHAVVVLVTIKVLPVARVPEEQRFLVRKVGVVNGTDGKPLHVMYRCVARYGYMEGSRREKKIKNSDTKVSFEEALMESLKDFISLQSMQSRMKAINGVGDDGQSVVSVEVEEYDSIEVVVDDEKTETAEGGSSSDQTSTLYESPVSTNGDDFSGESKATSDEDDDELSEIAKREINWLEASQKRGGITYLLGHADVKAAPGAFWFKRIVVNMIYDIIRRVCRENSVSQGPIPESNRLLKVGMVYEI
ncbi:hypothetical protein GOP47_0003498 [Adiantum capillus-veneris]|uniref:Potassium transporter n=1 Tax=Adiantum capillus-veneris TaxID=13818 RepID=A0A9D4ZSL1_ADICA|nr:hypothetical protein GOP47_0003498 [Adiantum capillus-veneris]